MQKTFCALQEYYSSLFRTTFIIIFFYYQHYHLQLFHSFYCSCCYLFREAAQLVQPLHECIYSTINFVVAVIVTTTTVITVVMSIRRRNVFVLHHNYFCASQTTKHALTSNADKQTDQLDVRPIPLQLTTQTNDVYYTFYNTTVVAHLQTFAKYAFELLIFILQLDIS